MRDSTDLGDLMKLSKLAQALDLHLSTLHRWRLAGRLPAVKIGGRWYVRRADALALCRTSPPASVSGPRFPVAGGLEDRGRGRVATPRTSAWAKGVLERFGLGEG